MAREDVVVHEEEDLGTAMQKLPIPFNELGIDLVNSFPDIGLEDFRELEDTNANEFMDDSNDSKPYSPTATKGCFHAPPKRSRNKKGRRKRQLFKSAACFFDNNFDITDKSCSHCGTRKTPMWREGPRGAGTLCNACGVRYRTGRLLPEYRPASSPDFKPNVHSNFHRRVMEIRSEKNSPPNSFRF